MNRIARAAFGCIVMVVVLAAGPVPASEPGASFLKEGDRWLFVGDSITHTDTYRQVLLRVLQHYHPDADIMVGNSAVAGVTSDYDETREFEPTLVTIMLGMNDVIHQDWPFTPSLEAKVEAYRKSMTAKVRRYREAGARVVLMTPTYTDERFPTYFNVAMTRRFLEAFGRVVREVARDEGCHWVPVAEELEAFQDTLGVDQHVRPDGVHPYGLGQYQIARTLWRHMNLAGTLTGREDLVRGAARLPLRAALASPFMHAVADGVTLTLSAEAPLTVTASWSLGNSRGTEILELGATPLQWRVPLAAEDLAVELGEFKRLVVDFSAPDASAVAVIDLARTPVVKLVDGRAGGELVDAEDRPEGRRIGTWAIEERGSELWLSGTVRDSELRWTPGWPFMRDGAALWLDLRPASRSGGINPDRDVFMAIVTVRDEPFFSAGLVPWTGPRLAYSAVSGGSRTADGYTWHLGIAGKFTDARAFDIRKLDYFGFNLSVCDSDSQPANATRITWLYPFTGPDHTRRLNQLAIVDRTGVFPGPETTKLHLFGF